MKLLEEQYRTMNSSVRAALDLAGILVQALAPMTRLVADDRLAEFITDVQKPGAPDDNRPDETQPSIN